jgi:hypothetical protein
MSTYMFTALGDFIGQANQNVFYLQHDDMSPEVLTFTVDRMLQAWEDNLMTWQSALWHLPAYSLRRVDVPGWPTTTYTLPTALAGDKPDDPLVTQASMYVKLNTGTLAPNRGAKYFGGFAEGSTALSNWVSAAMTACAATVQAMIDLHTNEPLQAAKWVVAKWNPPSAPGAGDGHTHVIATNRILTFSINSVPSTLGRRKIGRGA